MGNRNKKEELLERYIYDVTRRLPQNQRKDIELELRSLIDDMMDNTEPEGTSLNTILEKLGNPAELARKYRDESCCLIGAQYFDSYCLVLKIVLFCTFMSLVLSFIINTLTGIGQAEQVLKFFIKTGAKVFIEAIFTMVTAFGFVTIIFALIEHYKLKVTNNTEKSWKPSNLPPVPNQKARISRGDSIAEIILDLMIGGIIIFAPRIFGAWLRIDGNVLSVPIFNLEIWNIVMPLFLAVMAFNLIESIIKLIIGKYNNIVAISTSILDILSFFIIAVIFKYFPIWNPDFRTQLENFYGRKFQSATDLFSYWGSATFTNIILFVIFIITLINSGIAIYKSIRYGQYS